MHQRFWNLWNVEITWIRGGIGTTCVIQDMSIRPWLAVFLAIPPELIHTKPNIVQREIDAQLKYSQPHDVRSITEKFSLYSLLSVYSTKNNFWSQQWCDDVRWNEEKRDRDRDDSLLRKCFIFHNNYNRSATEKECLFRMERLGLKRWHRTPMCSIIDKIIVCS